MRGRWIGRLTIDCGGVGVISFEWIGSKCGWVGEVKQICGGRHGVL